MLKLKHFRSIQLIYIYSNYLESSVFKNRTLKVYLQISSKTRKEKITYIYNMWFCDLLKKWRKAWSRMGVKNIFLPANNKQRPHRQSKLFWNAPVWTPISPSHSFSPSSPYIHSIPKPFPFSLSHLHSSTPTNPQSPLLSLPPINQHLLQTIWTHHDHEKTSRTQFLILSWRI